MKPHPKISKNIPITILKRPKKPSDNRINLPPTAKMNKIYSTKTNHWTL